MVFLVYVYFLVTGSRVLIKKPAIERLFDLPRAAEAVRMSYIATSESDVQAPEVTYLGFPAAKGDCHIKSAHMRAAPLFVVKIATGFYANPAKGLPSSNGVNLLFSAETGELVATLQDEGWLTDMRTGLGGAIATLALARKNFQRVLIVGTGIQARLQARCLNALRPEAPMRFAFWGRRGDASETVANELREMGIDAHAVQELSLGCADADVIITTTPSKEPLVATEWVPPGAHITAIGADCPGKQELAVNIVASADLKVSDLASQCLHHGEYQTGYAAQLFNEDDIISLGSVLSGKHPGRTDRSQITVADLTGLAAQDAAISVAILDAAKANPQLMSLS